MFHKMAVLSSLDKSWTFVMLVFFRWNCSVTVWGKVFFGKFTVFINP